MRIKVSTPEGNGQEFEVKGEINQIFLSNEKIDTKFELVYDKDLKRNIWSISEKGKLMATKFSQNFVGLWVTTKGYFIHVIGPKEAFILTEHGRKMAHCEVNENGDTELVGKLSERQRGEEKFTTGGKKWPTPVVAD